MVRLRETRPYEILRESLLIGLAVVLPVLLTLYLLEIAVQMLGQVLAPVVAFLGALGIAAGVRDVLLELASGVGLLVVVLAVGLVAHFRTGQRAVAYLDALMNRVPLLGTVYGSFRRISDALLAGDTEQFRAVKLVEFPREGCRMLGFVTAETPDELAREDALTMFVPLAPNPVMAGFLVHVQEERVHDVDMTVEEGISAIVSLGAAEEDHGTGVLGPGGMSARAQPLGFSRAGSQTRQWTPQ